MSKLVAYIDADILCYQAVLGMDDEFDGGVVIAPQHAAEKFDELVENWLKHMPPVKKVILCLTGDENYRYDIDPNYKGQRTDVGKPPNLKPLRRLLMKRDNVLLTEGIEADDIIGMACSEDPKGRIAVSLDKDFKTVPCLLYRPCFRKSKSEGPTLISEDDANLFWMRQTLIGDTVDNIKGLYKCGPVKAEKVLPKKAPLEELWSAVVRQYEASGSTKEEALKNARLTRILRHGEYDAVSGVRLWSPNTDVPSA